MSQLLAQERPDIVGLQEAPVVFLTDPPSVGGRRHIFPLLKRYTVPKPTDGESDQALWLHQPIFTHFTPSNLKQIPIGEGLNSTVPATITRGQFQWKGRAFAVYNIHLRSFGTKKEDARQVQHVWAPAYWWSTLQLYRKDYRIRAEEAEDVRRLLDQESLPFIILGDFNSTPHNWEYWHIARGLQDTFSRVGQGWGGTYHSRFPAIRIDYVLASPEWQVVSAHVANARLSDHLPFIARLTFPPQAN